MVISIKTRTCYWEGKDGGVWVGGPFNATFGLAHLMLFGKARNCQVQSTPYYSALGRNRAVIISFPRCHPGEKKQIDREIDGKGSHHVTVNIRETSPTPNEKQRSTERKKPPFFFFLNITEFTQYGEGGKKWWMEEGLATIAHDLYACPLQEVFSHRLIRSEHHLFTRPTAKLPP